MRVALLLEDLLTGGAQVHAVDLGRRLQARGFAVQVLVLGAEVAPALAARCSAEPVLLRQAGLASAREWGRLARRLGDVGADLTVAVGPVATCVASAARLSGRLHGALASLFHCTAVGSLAGWLRVAPYLAAARSCDGLIFVSQEQRRHWGGRLRARQVRVIRNGVDLSRYRLVDPLTRREAKRRLGLDPERCTLGAIAMFRPEKNHAQMLEALAALRTQGAPVELLLVGDGPTRSATQARACALGVTALVRFAGEQADVRPYLAAMDAGLLCSTRVETLPLFGLELMAGGAPLAAARIGGLEELVEDDVDGLLFPAGDTAAMVRQLRRCLDAATRERLGQAAAAKARAFDVEVMADRYAAFARELVEGRRA